MIEKKERLLEVEKQGDKREALFLKGAKSSLLDAKKHDMTVGHERVR